MSFSSAPSRFSRPYEFNQHGDTIIREADISYDDFLEKKNSLLSASTRSSLRIIELCLCVPMTLSYPMALSFCGFTRFCHSREYRDGAHITEKL